MIVEDYYYTLRDIIFFLENIDCAIGEYRRLCLDRKIVAVVEQDRASLKGYLTGEISTCPQINVVAQTAQGVSSDETSTPSMHSAVPRSAESAPLLPDADMLKIRLNRRSSKRKLIDCDGPDPTFLEADKRELRAKRTDEIPAQTRATVLSKPGAVCSCFLFFYSSSILLLIYVLLN